MTDPSSLAARLDHIRSRIATFAEIDAACSVFGASRHEWQLEAPLEPEELAEFEHDHAISLPDELRAYLTSVAGSGAGPYYGLWPLPDEREADELRLPEPFVGDGDDETIATDTTRRGGYLPLADQGCGYASVLVLTGPRRGQVLADMREAHEGFVPEAPSFLAWIELWLDRALAEWAEQALPDILARGEELPLADEITSLLERRADERTWASEGNLHPLSPRDRLEALLHLRIHQGRLAEAEALIGRVRAVDDRDPEAREQLSRARIAAAREDAEARLAAADRGLALEHVWYATKTELLHEREWALLELDRRDEAIATMLERAAHTQHPHAYFDAAWLRVEEGDIAAAAQILVAAAPEFVDDEDDDTPFAEQTLDFAAGLFDALESDDKSEEAARLRTQVRELAARERAN